MASHYIFLCFGRFLCEQENIEETVNPDLWEEGSEELVFNNSVDPALITISDKAVTWGVKIVLSVMKILMWEVGLVSSVNCALNGNIKCA